MSCYSLFNRTPSDELVGNTSCSWDVTQQLLLLAYCSTTNDCIACRTRIRPAGQTVLNDGHLIEAGHR